MRLCALVGALLLLCACAPQPPGVEQSLPAPSPPVFSAPEPVSQPEPEPEVSYVEGLALAVAREAGVLELEGEAAVRCAYRWLVEHVYFTDPVGLDIWRYASPEEPLIPYLENRALSPLLFEIGSCEDFAAAMVLLLRSAGLEAEYVAGVTLSVKQEYIDHAWAVVKLGGTWYHIDPQLEQNVTRQNRLTWRYYLKSDDYMLTDHKWGENLIDYLPDLSPEEAGNIRENHLVPACPKDGPTPNTVMASLPMRPNIADVEQKILRIKAESGKGVLPDIPLNVEPPVLARRFHVTPPLQPQYASPQASGGRE